MYGVLLSRCLIVETHACQCIAISQPIASSHDSFVELLVPRICVAKQGPPASISCFETFLRLGEIGHRFLSALTVHPEMCTFFVK